MSSIVSAGPKVGWGGRVSKALIALPKFFVDPVGSNTERVIAVIVFAILFCIRQPLILSQGRFWAEEGQVFFERAWNLSWYHALLMPHAGYLNLTANVATLFARYLVPLRDAPYVTTSIALIIQCIPAVIILTSRVDWLQRRIVSALALAIIVSVPYSFELNLSSIGSHFYLGLAVALILALEPRSGTVGAFNLFVLILAPLSGPASWALVPLFALRTLCERSWLRALQTIALTTGVLLQVAFFFSTQPGRGIGISPTVLGAVVLAKHVVGPLLHSRWADGVINLFAPSFTEAGGPVWPLLLVAMLAIGMFMTYVRSPASSPLWLFCSAVAVAGIGYSGALADKTKLISLIDASRYAIIPQILLVLSLLGWGVVSTSRLRYPALTIVVWLIAVGVSDYRLVPVGPSWPQEVERWQQDKTYVLQIWPTGWTMTLPVK